MEETNEELESVNIMELIEEVIKDKKSKIEYKPQYNEWKQVLHLFAARTATNETFTEFFGDVYTEHEKEFTEEVLEELVTLSMKYLHELKKFED